MSLELFKLDGRVALITGGAQGLGLVMAKALAGAGASVAVTSRERSKAEKAAAVIGESSGQRAIGIAADVTDTGQVNSMVQTVIDEFGRIDILINNAGINIRKPVEEFEDEQWDQVQNTNLKAPFICSRAVARQMKQQRYGRVINVSSMLGSVALPERSAYCSSKGGLLQLTKVLALEWAPYNITVNALSPGPIATELNTVVMNNPEVNNTFLQNIALGRWGEPEEIAGAVIFLASGASSFMTGSSLVIDGGWTAK
ncbi:SDR family NAD(P)-dependent oxidoreductase [Paenibacillus allorhizosphaerae]|uniref:2-dehydro-3-deoxy-D-gluconate 5-dehydrogenase n=1 Tax=Paenibacillus allorhizosphaerae TaxID=2849866 RepID=A0ABM8VU23_9BACL|nr:glucose 1-dehydrogenase [Paenibacillus allorhizosphaerae]CAG7658050.1 2-dehydro-3-deoxy-D-gluconate 5-dehydrogenase [Paenibacillus allorhizosphaerae]